MEKIKIGKTDLQVARINLGGNVFGWTLNEEQSFEILDDFVGEGFDFIDTSNSYSWWVNGKGGQSETIIGNWMKSRSNRGKIIIATKVGSETKEHPLDISKKHILKSVDESLQRLQTDYIDLYYTHFDDNVTPVEETLSAYDEVIKAGKVKYIAASNVSIERLKKSLELGKNAEYPMYQALQPHYNLVERTKYETEYAPIVEEYGLTVFPYWSLASGFLSGKYRSEADLGKSTRGGNSKKYLNAKGLSLLEALDKISKAHNTQQASVALAWLLAQPHIGAPIVSATSKSQLKAIVDATNLKLNTEDFILLDERSK
ncbi:aldo/keto reductase [Bacteroides ihuae]|uniref:aldo/keto reductase n=1 Tax=Bacteroides ihuae TaxID=1852362 RepID=UPI0008D90BF8|nr:aldo/keto reductase [Bacteroides ihuae]